MALADLVVAIHASFVVFVVAGGLLALRWPKMLWVHAPSAVWGVVVEYAGFICPLTPLEVALRQRAGGQGYRGGFVEHYVEAILYPSGLTRELQVVLGSAALLANLAIYWYVLGRWRKRRDTLAK